jgi:hypothetical protein
MNTEIINSTKFIKYDIKPIWREDLYNTIYEKILIIIYNDDTSIETIRLYANYTCI